MASLSSFSDVLEEELSAHIQKTVPVKTKIIAAKYDIKIFKGKKKMNLKLDAYCKKLI